MLIIALELYKHYLENPIVQFGLYNFASFLLLAVALPYFFTSIDIGLFIAAGWISFMLVCLLVLLLQKSPSIAAGKYKILLVSFLIFVAMNIFYFYNFIPPVPLSIRDIGLYHSVVRTGSSYVVEAEPQTFWQKLGLTRTLHLAPGEQAYVYTAIFSPSDLNTDIVHDWQYYDPAQKQWVSESRVTFHLIGGRQEGYRGYSYKTDVQAGQWRVYVETPRGQVLGRFEFNVVTVNQAPALEQGIK